MAQKRQNLQIEDKAVAVSREVINKGWTVLRMMMNMLSLSLVNVSLH